MSKGCAYPAGQPARKQMVAYFLSYALIVSSLAMLAVPAASQKPQSAKATASDSNWKISDHDLIDLKAVDPAIKMSVDDQIFVSGAERRRTRPGGAVAAVGKTTFVAFNVEFDSEESQRKFTPPGTRGSVGVFNRFDRFADVLIAYNAQAEANLNAICRSPGVVWLEQAGAVEVPPPSRTRRGPRPKGEVEKIVRGGVDGLTGKGVIVAIVDSGVDFRNPDFITYDAQGRPTSRLLYLWDTTNYAFNARNLGTKPPITYPNGTPVGTIYTREQLTNELR